MSFERNFVSICKGGADEASRGLTWKLRIKNVELRIARN